MELQVTLDGDSRVSTRIGNHTIQTDQPLKSGGQDSAPAPFDLFVASIATCAGYFVQSYCRNKQIPTDGIDIRLRTRRDPETKKITAFVTTITLPPGLPPQLHKTLERVAAQCAVTKAIENRPEFLIESRTGEG